jgi:DNA-binding NtrC family response regulator
MPLDAVDVGRLLGGDLGALAFGDSRAVMLDAAALGCLRQQLVEVLGRIRARALLLRTGYVHGWRAAEALSREIPLEGPGDWTRSLRAMHSLLGLGTAEQAAPMPGPEPLAALVWRDSWEAEQHLVQLGRSPEPVCWTLAGFASGFFSFSAGREVLFREQACAGMGHETCLAVGRTREEWIRVLHGIDPQAAYAATSLHEPLRSLVEGVQRLQPQAGRRGSRRVRLLDPRPEVPEGLVAQSEGMRRVVDMAHRLAAVETTVLVTGESGVGKERIARLVHLASPRAARPFLAVNCAAIPEALVESELFGHARGSFTGASSDRPGLFEEASGGTLFLDEVGELPLSVQPKLLRALEEGEVRRLGEARPRPFDVRIAAATNRDLERDVAAGRFRRDLLYRLKVVEISIPPLRRRPEDLLPLAQAALEAAARRLGRPIVGLTPAAADQLGRYRWPGNVRELWNAMERAAVLADGPRVDLLDLPEEVRAALPASRERGPGALERLEREAVLAALRQNHGHRARTARQLGIGEATLYRRLRAWRARA